MFTISILCLCRIFCDIFMCSVINIHWSGNQAQIVIRTGVDDSTLYEYSCAFENAQVFPFLSYAYRLALSRYCWWCPLIGRFLSISSYFDPKRMVSNMKCMNCSCTSFMFWSIAGVFIFLWNPSTIFVTLIRRFVVSIITHLCEILSQSFLVSNWGLPLPTKSMDLLSLKNSNNISMLFYNWRDRHSVPIC